MTNKTIMAKTKIILISIFFLLAVFLDAEKAGADWSLGLCIGDGCGSGSGGGGWNPGALSMYGLPEGSIINIIENILYWLLAVLGIAGVIGFVISGILYLISTGDETMIDRAKEAMKWSIVGVVVGLAGVVVIQAVNLMLNAVSGF